MEDNKFREPVMAIMTAVATIVTAYGYTFDPEDVRNYSELAGGLLTVGLLMRNMVTPNGRVRAMKDDMDGKFETIFTSQQTYIPNPFNAQSSLRSEGDEKLQTALRNEQGLLGVGFFNRPRN